MSWSQTNTRLGFTYENSATIEAQLKTNAYGVKKLNKLQKK